MENKNNVLVFSLVFLIIGIFVGWLICNNKTVIVSQTAGMHQMADGTMMGNVPVNMESMMGGMMAGLQGKTGDAFDKEFLAQMIVHHQGAVEMAKAVLATSKRPELIKLANDIISAQTKEIGMMQEWQKVWFK
ncbi:MAG: DUF305 domain-containing protein [Patescibacteria group bacterium]